MRNSRLLAALSIPLGFVLGHLLAYGLACDESAEVEAAAHGYFESLSGSAVPLGLFAILLAVLQGRQGQKFQLRTSKLCGQLVAVYVVIEIIEHLSIGLSPGEIVTEKTLTVGVLVQIGIGIGIGLLLRAGHRLGELLSEGTAHCHDGHVDAPLVPTHQIVRLWLRRSSLRLRGPPIRITANPL